MKNFLSEVVLVPLVALWEALAAMIIVLIYYFRALGWLGVAIGAFVPGLTVALALVVMIPMAILFLIFGGPEQRQLVPKMLIIAGEFLGIGVAYLALVLAIRSLSRVILRNTKAGIAYLARRGH